MGSENHHMDDDVGATWLISRIGIPFAVVESIFFRATVWNPVHVNGSQNQVVVSGPQNAGAGF